MKTIYQLLLIEDNLSDALQIRQYLANLKDFHFDIHHATYFKGAVELIKKKNFDLILSELTLPDSKIFDTIYELTKLAGQTPIVAVSHSTDEEIALRAVEMGVQDFIFKKQLATENLKNRILFAIQRKKNELVNKVAKPIIIPAIQENQDESAQNKPSVKSKMNSPSQDMPTIKKAKASVQKIPGWMRV